MHCLFFIVITCVFHLVCICKLYHLVIVKSILRCANEIQLYLLT